MANIIIIGGGAAGLMAAGTARHNGHNVTVIEHGKKCGQKLLITGKGRCNVTNNCDEEAFLKNVRTNPRFLFSSIYSFTPFDTMAFFERLGVPLKTERGRRVFPQSDRAQDILDALLEYAEGCTFFYDNAKSIICENGSVKGVAFENGKAIYADAVILATGGLSYGVTGSDGSGYKMAQKLGHTIVTPVPSLVSLVEKGKTCVQMMGLSLKNINVSLIEDNKKCVFSEQGEMLFTHFGVSGPLILSASAHIGDMQKHSYHIEIDLKPALDEQQLYKRITSDFEIMGAKTAANCLAKLLPKRMEPIVLKMWGMDEERKISQITKEEKQSLVKLLKAFPIEIKERGSLDHAVITSGGISTKEINPKTMESKLISGLYFAGEIIDVDAYTGGYNLQIAFSTAYAAASHIEEE